MDRSIYTALVSLFRNRPRDLAISRAELQARLVELCGVEVHVRDLQRLLDDVAMQEHWCVVSETRGYWRLDDNAFAEDIAAAEHSVNTLRAHAQAEMDKARLREKWIDLFKTTRENLERQRTRIPQQAGFFS